MRPALINAFRPNAQIPFEEVNPFIRSEIKKAKKPKVKSEVLEWKEAKAAVPFLPKQDRKKHNLWAKQKGLCAYCDRTFKDYFDCSLDHIKPKSKGGSNKVENLALVCHPCNNLKANYSSLEEATAKARRLIAFFTKLKERGFIE